jgi:aspartyl-tRNA(Asn)/glutamyl-tRNA(Gln) amidotransferase subunit A
LLDVKDALSRIADPHGTGPLTFIRVFESQAAATAQAWDRARRGGLPVPPLAGVPISVKDLFDVAGSVTTAGSKVLCDAAPALEDAPAVARLRAAGAVIVGTTNMTDFAFGSLGINPHYGTPPNPFDRSSKRIPGGSSSGAAVSVCDDMAVIAIGSDAAGSIRAPAAYCGIAGFKSTARRIPLGGAIPLSTSLDSIGPLARTVAQCALADAVLAGEDPAPLQAFPLAGLRFALAKTVVLDDLEEAVAGAFSRTVTMLSKAGATITEIEMPEIAELWSLGLTHAFTVAEGYAWHRKLLSDKRELYDPIIAGRLLEGAHVSASDYIDLHKTRARLIESSRRRTSRYDAVVMPTLAITARRIADLEKDREYYAASARATIRNPNVANCLDRCALTIPCHEPGSAPVGFTLMGETMADRKILAIGLAVEEVLSEAGLAVRTAKGSQ